MEDDVIVGNVDFPKVMKQLQEENEKLKDENFSLQSELKKNYNSFLCINGKKYLVINNQWNNPKS